MTEPEKMEALKRAYAEMILNTAKEAAARVTIAGLRSRRLEHDLVSTKDEAARMLLHLKQMIEAKTKEVEITSLEQHKKIDELESQLNEAEGIIIDLRAELDQAHEQLDDAKNKKLHFSRHNGNAEARNLTPEGTGSGYELFTVGGNNTLEWTVLDQKFDSECDVCSVESHTALGQLKEPEMLKNGRTRRICATETSLVQDRCLVGDESTNMDTVTGVGNSVLAEKSRHGKNEEVVSIVRRSLRKRKLKLLDDVFTACGSNQSRKFKKPRAVSNLSCCNTSNVRSSVKSGDSRLEAENGAQSEES